MLPGGRKSYGFATSNVKSHLSGNESPFMSGWSLPLPAPTFSALQTIIATMRHGGFGLKHVMGLLEDSARANQTWYTENQCAMGVLLYRVGGPSAVQILNVANLLPSVRHMQ